MIWLIVLVAVPLFLLIHGHEIFIALWSDLGPRVFIRRADGTFSRWQIAGQIVVVGVPALLTICLFAGWIAQSIRGI